MQERELTVYLIVACYLLVTRKHNNKAHFRREKRKHWSNLTRIQTKLRIWFTSLLQIL